MNIPGISQIRLKAQTVKSLVVKAKKTLKSDVQAVFDMDPAARNIVEVAMYQGLWAITNHRIAHALYTKEVPYLPRAISQLSRLFTQIEIHPGATIGQGFFIDHGTGVVIGETCEIGNNVLVYAGVTLGGTGNETGKRHPTIGNGVIFGANSVVLGSINIGNNVRIGGGAIVVKDVPDNSTVVCSPAQIIKQDGKRLDPLDHGNLPEKSHTTEINKLKEQVEALQQQLDQHK